MTVLERLHGLQTGLEFLPQGSLPELNQFQGLPFTAMLGAEAFQMTKPFI